MWSRTKVHVLIPGTYEYVTFHGKGDFADVTNFKDFEMKRQYWIIRVGLITRVFIKGRKEVRERRQCHDGTRYWNGVALSQGTQEASRNRKREGMDSL